MLSGIVLVLRDVFVSRRTVGIMGGLPDAGFSSLRVIARNEAIQKTVYSLDCFVVPPRNDAKHVGAKRRLFP